MSKFRPGFKWPKAQSVQPGAEFCAWNSYLRVVFTAAINEVDAKRLPIGIASHSSYIVDIYRLSIRTFFFLFVQSPMCKPGIGAHLLVAPPNPSPPSPPTPASPILPPQGWMGSGKKFSSAEADRTRSGRGCRRASRSTRPGGQASSGRGGRVFFFFFSRMKLLPGAAWGGPRTSSLGGLSG